MQTNNAEYRFGSLLRWLLTVTGTVLGMLIMGLLMAGPATAEDRDDGLLSPVTEAAEPLLDHASEPVARLAAPVAEVVEPVAAAVEPVLEPVRPVLDLAKPLVEPVVDMAEPVTSAVGLDPVTKSATGDGPGAQARQDLPAPEPATEQPVTEWVPEPADVYSPQPATVPDTFSASARPMGISTESAQQAGGGHSWQGPVPTDQVVPGGLTSAQAGGGSSPRHDPATAAWGANSPETHSGWHSPPRGSWPPSWLFYDDLDHPS